MGLREALPPRSTPWLFATFLVPLLPYGILPANKRNSMHACMGAHIVVPAWTLCAGSQDFDSGGH